MSPSRTTPAVLAACAAFAAAHLVATCPAEEEQPAAGADPAETTETAETTAKSILGDPRLQNMLRSVKSDPEEAVETLKKQDPDEAVRAATELYRENREELDPGKLDTPENRDAATSTAERALSTLQRMLPRPSASTSDAPATRPPPGSPEAQLPPPGETPPEEGADAGPQPVPQTVVQESSPLPLAGTAPTEPRIPGSPDLLPEEVPDPEPLKPAFEKPGRQAAAPAGDRQMEITSRESVMDQESGVLRFSGSVVIRHPDFTIQCDHLEIHLAEGVTALPGGGGGGGGAPPFRKAVASGGMVEIRRVSPDGKTQIAMARRAEYNAVSQDIILSGGPPYVQDGESYMETSSPDAQIVMHGDGRVEVKGSDNRNRIVIPVPKPKGGDRSDSTGLGNVFDRNR